MWQHSQLALLHGQLQTRARGKEGEQLDRRQWDQSSRQGTSSCGKRTQAQLCSCACSPGRAARHVQRPRQQAERTLRLGKRLNRPLNASCGPGQEQQVAAM